MLARENLESALIDTNAMVLRQAEIDRQNNKNLTKDFPFLMK
jgi:hypothetical protein